MALFKLGDKYIERNGDYVYIIAEIGQNHQGNLDLAKKMILEAKRSGCDCVKFQKSCLEERFTESALERPYENENSWGKTYGEHKRFLEFSIEQYKELQKYSRQIGIDFTASAMDEVSLNELYTLNVPFIKIGSGDANNFPLLRKAAKLHCPLLISTGMQTMETIDRIVDIMKDANKIDYALLHCVSSYPTEAKDTNLGMIPLYLQTFKQIVIGYSGHELGIEISQAAVLLGARIVERHFTLDKLQKGSDHKCSLNPLEMSSLVTNVRNLINAKHENITYDKILELVPQTPDLVEAINSIPQKQEKVILSCEEKCRLKLGKSIVATQDLCCGEVIDADDLCVKVSEPNGISAEYYDFVLGSEVYSHVSKDSPLTWEHLQESTRF